MNTNTAPTDIIHNEVEFAAKLAEFVALVQTKATDHYAKDFPNLTADRISMEPGRKYIRIVRTGQNKDHQTGEIKDGQRMVWGFVEMGTGHILKADGWAKPAKHPRGNIFNANQWDGMTNYGPGYLPKHLQHFR